MTGNAGVAGSQASNVRVEQRTLWDVKEHNATCVAGAPRRGPNGDWTGLG